MAISNIRGVLCCGNAVIDVMVWPAEDCDWNTTKWVETIAEGIGGNGANTSYTLAKLGVPARLIGIVGSDTRGDRLIETLSAAGVDVSLLSRRAGLPTSSTVVLVRRGGDRKFLHRPGVSRELRAENVVFETQAQISHFHLANPFALPELRYDIAGILSRAKAAGLSTSIDAGWDSRGRWLTDLGDGLPLTDLLFVNDSEARMLGGNNDLTDAVGVLQKRGATGVIVKTGATGCSVFSGNSSERFPGLPVDAIDTTGAGDCFAGGFLAGLHRGWSYADCARLANAVGAMNVEQLGAITGVRSFDETVAWIRSKLADS